MLKVRFPHAFGLCYPHAVIELREPPEERPADSELNGDREGIIVDDPDLCILAELVVDGAEELSFELQRDLGQLAGLHFECLPGVVTDDLHHGGGFFGLLGIRHNLDLKHAVNAEIRRCVRILLVIGDKVVVVVADYQRDGIDRIVLPVAVLTQGERPFPVLVQIEIKERDLPLFLQRRLNGVDVVKDTLVRVLMSVEILHAALHKLSAVRTAKTCDLVNECFRFILGNEVRPMDGIHHYFELGGLKALIRHVVIPLVISHEAFDFIT